MAEVDNDDVKAPGGQAPAPKAKGKLAGRVRAFAPTFKEGVIGLLALNAVVTGVLLWKVETTRPPVIATVGVSALTRMFVQRVGSDPSLTPEALKLKTTMFQDVIRQKVSDLATKRGLIIMARECILSGENEDLTPVIEQALTDNLKSTTETPKGGLDDDLLN